MPKKRANTSEEIYQIKVTLLGTSPSIWRRLRVPANLTLEQLHDVLQLAIGWEDCHMHEFRIGQKRFGKPDPDDRLIGNEHTARLFSEFGRVGAKAVYSYDFGDNWEHSISLEKVLPPKRVTHIRLASAANVMVRPKTVAVCQVSTTFSKRSATQNTTNTKKRGIGWATILIPRPFLLTTSTEGSQPYINTALGFKGLGCPFRDRGHLCNARLPKGHPSLYGGQTPWPARRLWRGAWLLWPSQRHP